MAKFPAVEEKETPDGKSRGKVQLAASTLHAEVWLHDAPQ